MMPFPEKFIIFIILITVHLAISDESYAIDFQQRNKSLTTLGLIQYPPTTPRVIPVFPPSPTPPICDLEDISFRFSDVGLQKIGQDFIRSNNIISLSLDNNEIKDISPSAFRSIRNLRYLNLSGNKIPKERLLSFAGNDKLQTLIINNNNDSRVPAVEMKVLKEYVIFINLEHLHLSHNQLGDFQVPFNSAVPKLTHLHLSNNSIKSGETVFNNIPLTLTHLYLDNNMITRVEQHKLRSLQKLVMDNNIITEICFENCEKNEFISLRGAVRMQNLSLSQNMISKISVDAFKDTKYLEYLDLSGNKIADVAKGTFNYSVMIKELSLANNTLAAIPDICSIMYLKNLNLIGNRISAVHFDNFCPMRNLEDLYLADNVITTIESRAFFNLPMLKYLDLSGNRLRQLPVHWISQWSLQELHLERNNFAKLDDVSLVNIKSMRNVYIDDNPMPSLRVETFQSLPSQLTIHLSSMHVEHIQCKCNVDDDDDKDNENEEEYDENDNTNW